MQLNKTVKQKIIIGLGKKILKAKGEAICAEADAFLIKAFDAEHKVFNDMLKEKLSKEELERCFSYGAEPSLIEKTQNGRGQYIPYPIIEFFTSRNNKVKIAGRYGWVDATLSHYLSIRQIQHGGNVRMSKEHPLWDEYKALRSKMNDFQKRGDEKMRQLEAVIMPQKTDTRLLELLPEAGEFIKAPVKSTDMVPIDTVEDIRKALGAAA
ncbi:MAG: hypothetical protein MK185_04815 [Saccharospirillaceae bacterium]|nr:hypothetical protein [Saccharospirillaceae bacterium]